MPFIHKNFLLYSEIGRRLYHTVAAHQPIIDYHCHLSPKEIWEDAVFDTISDIWLRGDHYKWRAMRANGVEERYITGDASAKEKFKKWAETVEHCIGNPLYHWTALELQRYFGIDKLLSPENRENVWETANAYIKKTQLSPRKLIKQSNVRFLSTTDSPLDTLEYHKRIKADSSIDFTVMPGFRPDDAFAIGETKFLIFLQKLETIAGRDITSYQTFIEEMKNRIRYFHANGCRICDHGLSVIPFAPYQAQEVEAVFDAALRKEPLSEKAAAQYVTKLIVDLAAEYRQLGWVMQIHFGALRNNNTAMFQQLGADSGFDSINDQANAAYCLNGLLDAISVHGGLPKMIVYNLNPALNDLTACTVANFQGNTTVKGKIQFGAAWWFNDTKAGMLRQLQTLCDHGLLMHFIGMLTDSRSFLSYARHEYFRRILCEFVGEQVEKGEFPNDEQLITSLIENICYKNAHCYFGLEEYV